MSDDLSPKQINQDDTNHAKGHAASYVTRDFELKIEEIIRNAHQDIYKSDELRRIATEENIKLRVLYDKYVASERNKPELSTNYEKVMGEISINLKRISVLNISLSGLIDSFGTSKKPPKAAEIILGMALTAKQRDAFLGDKEEEFMRDAAKRGLLFARCVYWADTLRSLGPLAWAAFKRTGWIVALWELKKRISG